MRNWTRFVLAVAGAVGWLPACGETSGGGAGSAPVAESDFPPRFSEAACRNMGSCCRSNGYTYDFETCRSAMETYLRSFLLSRRDLQVRFDPAAAGTCLDAYSRALRECTPMEDHGCPSLFVGLVEPGGACTQSDECADGPEGVPAYCDSGVCTPDSFSSDPVPRVQGETCSRTCTRYGSGWGCSGFGAEGAEASYACFTDDGIYCNPSSRLCEVLPELGASCATSDGCAAGAFCELGTCVPKRETGPCQTDAACADTAYCDYDAGQCASRLADGSACDMDAQCRIGNCQDGVCRARVPVDTGICVGILGD